MSDYSQIPEEIMNSLSDYVNREYVPMGFLYQVLCNNLFGAIHRADATMKPLIPLLCEYIFWEIPGDCWGSREIVKAYMAEKQDTGKAK